MKKVIVYRKFEGEKFGAFFKFRTLMQLMVMILYVAFAPFFAILLAILDFEETGSNFKNLFVHHINIYKHIVVEEKEHFLKHIEDKVKIILGYFEVEDRK